MFVCVFVSAATADASDLISHMVQIGTIIFSPVFAVALPSSKCNCYLSYIV